MKIMTFVTEDRVISDLHGADKLSVLRELSRPLVKACGLASPKNLPRFYSSGKRSNPRGLGMGLPSPMAE